MRQNGPANDRMTTDKWQVALSALILQSLAPLCQELNHNLQHLRRMPGPLDLSGSVRSKVWDTVKKHLRHAATHTPLYCTQNNGTALPQPHALHCISHRTMGQGFSRPLTWPCTDVGSGGQTTFWSKQQSSLLQHRPPSPPPKKSNPPQQQQKRKKK